MHVIEWPRVGLSGSGVGSCATLVAEQFLAQGVGRSLLSANGGGIAMGLLGVILLDCR